MERDKNFIQELLVEATLMKACRKYREGFSPPGEDEFTLGLIQMVATRKIPIWLVRVLTLLLYTPTKFCLTDICLQGSMRYSVYLRRGCCKLP